MTDHSGKPCSKTLASVPTLDDLVMRDVDHDCEGFGEHRICVRVEAVADLPTRFGRFRIVAFYNNRDGKEHIAIVHGDVLGGEGVLTRLHSECLTGDALGSLRCDCRDQLTLALTRIAQEPCGLLLYMRQEGRGIGLLNKIRAYALQDRGLDTVEANLALGFRDDERDYAIAAHMIASLTVGSIRLLTNNPRKVEELRRYGILVQDRIPHIVPVNDQNRFYLATKAHRSGHFLDLDGIPHLAEQDESADDLSEGQGSAGLQVDPN
ncbi:MAG: GTP cyclohydrolase II [Acidobacteria bacterium]|nr:GTP cyclohydrolase II [Acidobacteriota bacterium]MBI3486648.1 GTP cyclohydrolase II [Acidobacteriota bacterium]